MKLDNSYYLEYSDDWPHLYCGSNKGLGLRFCVDSQLRHDNTWKIYQPKYYEFNNKDEVNSPSILSHEYIFTNLSARVGYDTRSIFKQSLTGLNSEFSFSLGSCLTKAEETSLPYYLPIAGGRIIGFILFPRVLLLCEMQSVSSRIWTRVAVSISHDDNHYTMGTSFFINPSTRAAYDSRSIFF